MNIVIVSLRGPTNFPKRGGAQDYIQFVFKHFNLVSNKITIVCGAETYDGKPLPRFEIVDGLTIIRSSRGITRISSILNELSNHMHTADVVVENIMGFPLMLPVFFRLRKCSTPIIAIKHHYEGRTFLRTQGVIKGLIGIFLEEAVQPLFYSKVNLVGVSDLTINKIHESWIAPKLPVEKIPPGIEISTQNVLSSKSTHPLILYFGSIDIGRKRIDHLIDAFKMLAKKIPDSQLIIGGAGPDLDELISRAKGLNVEFTGFISEREKSELLEKSWLFASPSNSEGFGITWIEANAYGLPVVGYDLGLDTVNSKCSMMVQMNDVAKLCDAMFELIQNNELRNMMSLASKDNAKRFNWKNSSEKFQMLINQVIMKKI